MASRLTAILAGVALVAAGCGTAPKTPSTGGGLVQGGTTFPATTAVRTPTNNGGGNSGGGGGGARPVTTMRGGQPNDGGAGGANADEAVRRAAGGSPGAFAGVVLAPAAAPSIAVDVLVQSGASADQPTLDAVRSLLASHSGKSVTLRSPIAITAAGDVHSADQIRQLADQHGTAQGSGRAVIHLLYLTGQYTDENALGVTVRGDTVAVFPDQIASSATPFVSRARIERAVVTHEIGHVLGLVDLFLDDHRDDPEHPGHSSNTRSVMYWAVEADIVAQVLDGPPPVDFDADDNADLARIHSGAAHA